MVIELKPDHTAKLTMDDMESEDDDSVIWEVKDNKVILSDDTGETLEMDIVDDKTISYNEDGVVLEFIKQ